MGRQQFDRLKIGNRITSRDELFNKSPDEGQRILQKAKLDNVHVQCICNGEHSPVFMTTAKVDSRMHIRRLPNQGSKHNQMCPSYGGINERASELYTNDALQEKGDCVEIRIDGPLSEILGESKAERAPVRDFKATQAVRRGSMTLLGVLNYLWEEAGLNVWWPRMEGKRGRWTMRSAILDACIGRTFKNGRSLRDFLFIPETSSLVEGKWASRAESNETNLLEMLAKVEGAGAENETCFGILVGEVSRVIDPRPGQKSAGIVLKDLSSPLWDNHGVIKRLDVSFQHAMERTRRRQVQGAARERKPSDRGANPDEYRLIGIFAVALGKNRQSVVLKQGAVMETSSRYIPIASDFEGKVERKLCQEGRAFEKPLVYDGERWTFPDFILIDTDLAPKPVLEVYGYSGDEYESRKRTKHVEYVRTRTPYWHWDLKVSREIPSFDQFPPSERFKRR